MKKNVILLTALLVLALLSGCDSPAPAQIAASTMPVYDFTAALCQGTGLTVVPLITEQVSCVHDYSLTVKQMKTIESVDRVVLSGAGLEEFMEKALHSVAKVVDSSEGVALLEGTCHHEHGDEGDAHGHEHGHTHEEDPHIWLSPANARIMIGNIHSALAEAYPEHRVVFDRNLEELLARLDALERYAEVALAGLSSREIITFHDGFGYLAQAFGLEILEAIEEESGSEPSAQELIGLIELVEHHGVTAIFVEQNGSSAAASVISRETGVPVYTLDMGMSGNGWFEAMYHNIDTLKEALG